MSASSSDTALAAGKSALAVAGLALTFTAATALGLLVHADLPVARRVAARAVSRVLSDALGGTVLLEPFSHLGIARLTVPKITLQDEYSAQVLTLSDVRIDVSARRIVEELLFDRVKPTIVVNHLRVEHADVTLAADPKTGEPTIARAITPTEAAGSAAAPESGLRVYLPAIEIGLVTAHARLAGQRPFEADVRRVQGLLLATQKGIAVDVKRFGVALRGLGADARGTGTLAVRAPGPLRGTFEGFFGDVELKASVFLEGAHVEGVVDVPRATPEAAGRLLPGWPLREAVSGHIDARGDLPDLTVLAALSAGGATIDGKGQLHIADPVTAAFDVASQHLDARLLSPSVPKTDLTVRASVSAHLDTGRLVASVKGHTDPTAIAGQLVPETDLEATWQNDVATGTAHVHEPGVPLTASFRASRVGALDVDAEAGPFQLSRLPRLPVVGLEGAGNARVQIHVAAGKAEASVAGDIRGFRAAGGAVERAHVTARLTAPIDALEHATGTLHVAGDGASVGTLSAKHVAVDAHGTFERLEFDARAADDETTEIRATGVALLGRTFLIRGTKVSLRRDPVVIQGEIEELDPKEGTVDVRSIHVAGAGGTMTGAARLGRDLIEVEAEGENIDMAAVGRALGLPRGLLGGTLRVSANVATGHDVTRGRVRVGLGNATLGMVGGVSAQISVDLEGTHLEGGASGLVAGLGTFGGTWDGELGGPAFEWSSFRSATGKAEVQVGNVRLALLSPLIPKEAPVSHLGGQAFARVLLSRKTAEAGLPDVFATVATRELAMDVGRGSAEQRLTGIDVTTTGALSGKTGDSTGTTVLTDRQGTLVVASGAIQVDVEKLLDEPARALAQLVDTPLDVIVSVPTRRVSDFPAPLALEGISGTLSGNGSVKGTLAHPTLFVSVEGLGMEASSASISRPIDLHASGQYEWTTREVSARGTAALSGLTVAAATFRGQVPEGGPSAWRGEGQMDFSGLPLELVSRLGKSGVTGKVFGTAFARRTGAGGDLRADIRLEGAAVLGTPLGTGRFTLETRDDAVQGTLGFEGERGKLDAEASAELSWASGYPTLAVAPVRAHVVAREFGAVALVPFVRPILSRLGGRIDADVTGALEPKSGGGELDFTGGIQGTATLSEGSALIETLGLDVRDLGVTLSAHGQGGTTSVSVTDLHGRVRSPKDNVHGSAELVLEGVRLTRGTGSISAEDVPILFHGAPQGRITGSAGLRLQRGPDGYLVDADVPALTATLPEASTRNVLDVGDNPDVTIVQLAREPESTGAETPWRIAAHLGNAVRIKHSKADLAVTGSPTVDLGETTSMTGSIDLTPGGAVVVMGRPFLVEHGRVVFDTGEPQNPRLDVTASWRAPSDTIVLVDVTGTLKDAKITLRSDPPLPEAEVTALVLGGGSGVATAGLNELLTDNPVELRVEQTSESRPRYTAAVRVRENLWFEASTYQQSQANASAGNDRSVYSGTIDYRFSPRWSLRTEAGTAGGALDLLWQYRY